MIYEDIIRLIYTKITSFFNVEHGIATLFTNGDTTPSVKGGMLFYETNSGAITITDFDDGVGGQIIIIIFRAGNTTVEHNGTSIYLSNGANYLFSIGDSLVLIKMTNPPFDAWVQIGGDH